MSTTMVSRRSLTLLVALLLAALAAAALLSYVRGVEKRTTSGGATISVLVARDQIPAGMTADRAGTEGLLTRQAIPQRFVPDGAITSITQIEGQISVGLVRKGEVIVGGRFVPAAQVTGILPIPADRQAMSIDVDLANAVGGFIQPGNQVSLIAKIDVRQGSDVVSVAKYLVQDVKVLAVNADVVAVPGATSANAKKPAQTQQANRVQLTLALSPVEAEKVVYAQLTGTIVATLVPNGQKTVTSWGPNVTNEFN